MLRELQFISPKMGRTEPVKVALATKMTNVTYKTLIIILYIVNTHN